jgi:hypothetical protein
MNRRALVTALACLAVLAGGAAPATAKVARPPPYRLQPLAGDAFRVPAVLESDFGGDYSRLAYIPAADSDAAGRALLQAVPPVATQELTFTHAGRTLKYLAVGDLAKPAKIVVVYVHGFGDDRAQGMNETRFGASFARLKRVIAANGGVYLSPDFSGFGQEAKDEVAALIADYAARSPAAPVFAACMSYGGGVCWRLAEAADPASPLRGILVFGAPVDSAFVKTVPALARPLPVYVAVGTKDAFASWKSAATFFRAVKALAPDYPIRLAVFDAGEHATAIRLTDWVAVLNWMLAGGDGAGNGAPAAASAAAAAPCPRLRPAAGDHAAAAFCGRP